LVIRIDVLLWIFFGNERGQPSEIRIKVDCPTVARLGEIEACHASCRARRRHDAIRRKTKALA